MIVKVSNAGRLSSFDSSLWRSSSALSRVIFMTWPISLVSRLLSENLCIPLALIAIHAVRALYAPSQRTMIPIIRDAAQQGVLRRSRFFYDSLRKISAPNEEARLQSNISGHVGKLQCRTRIRRPIPNFRFQTLQAERSSARLNSFQERQGDLQVIGGASIDDHGFTQKGSYTHEGSAHSPSRLPCLNCEPEANAFATTSPSWTVPRTWLCEACFAML